jgi:hypothetical protein
MGGRGGGAGLQGCSIPNRMQDSPLWKDLMKVRYIYLRGRGYKLNNRKYINI